MDEGIVFWPSSVQEIIVGDMGSVSISDNITRLCKCIHQSHNAPAQNKSLRTLRTRSYSILLNTYSVADELWDGTSEVLAHSCALQQHDEHKRLCALLEQLPQDTSVESVLHFLALMAGEGENLPRLSYEQTELLRLPKISKRCYQELDLSIFAAPEEPRCLRYGNFPFDKDPGTGLSVLGSFGEQRSSDNWRTDMEEIHKQMVTVLSKPRDLMIPMVYIPTQDVLQYRDEGYGSPGDEQFRSLTISMTTPTEKKCEENMWDLVLKVQMPQQRTWEALGSLDPPKEKLSPAEAGPEALRRAWMAKMALEQMYHEVTATKHILVPPVSRKEFVQDLKLLLMGIPSNTFHFNKELQMFEMNKEVHIDGITAETLAKFSRDFIVSGTCCCRLWELVSKNSASEEGLIFQALFDSTQRYLKLHRAAVMSLPDGPLLHKLRQRFKGLHVQISCISQLFGIHPELGTKEVNLPEGVKLLAHMYQQICRATSPELACVLYFFFRSCCQVYFRLLEKWIFEGNCQQTHQEFFIHEVTDITICRTREYWSKAHILLHDAVPSFLTNLAEIIFQCGKALNLLKLCCPQNPLCSVLRGGFPSLRCCLQASELQELKAECETFYQRALEVCGSPVDIAGIFTAAQEQEKLLQTKAELLQKERLTKLQKEKQIRAEEAAKEKREQLAVLKEQIELAVVQRDMEKQRDLEEDRLLAQQYESERQLIEEEKQRLVDHYATMAHRADQRRLQAEWHLKRMHLRDKRVEFLTALDNEMSLLGDDNNNNNNAEQEPCDTVNNNSVTETCLESPDNNTPAVEAPEQSAESAQVPGSPVSPSTESAHVPGSPVSTLQSPDSPCIPESPGTSPTNSPSKHQSEVDIFNDFCRQQFQSAASARARNRRRVLESEFDIVTGQHRESQLSVVTVDARKTTSLAVTKQETKEKEDKKKDETLTVLPHRDYTLPSDLGDAPMITLGSTLLPDHLPSTAFNIGTFDTTSVTATLQKSVVVPLEMQVRLVNSALIKFFLLELELVAHLSTLRSYYFLLDGEFSRSMTCALFGRMAVVRSAAELLDCVALNSLLARSLTLSSDPRAERFSFGVKIIPAGYSQSSPQLLDSITLQYQVAWPLNIILTEICLEKYSDVFSFLLRLRRISWVLEEDFHLLKRVCAGAQRSQQYHRVQLHRYEMTHFVRALQNYVTSTAIQGSWVEFQRSLQHAQTLEDLYRKHVDYMKNVRFRCLLNRQCAGIQKALSDTFKMILKFHGQLSSHSWQRVSGTNEYRHPHFSTLEEIYTCFHNVAVFTFKFATKLANTGYQPHLWDLLQMLNINGFYPPYY